MILLALGVGLSTLAIGVGAALVIRLLPSVRLQLGALVLMSVTLPLAAVVLSGLVMFHMGADTAVLVVSASAATASVVGAVLLERGITHRLGRLEEASGRVAAGELETRVATRGPTELAAVATSFNTMAAGLEDSLEARRQMTAWASHDLRAPISSMQAMLEAIEDGVVSPEHYLGSLRGQVRLLAALADDLAELARIDTGAVPLDVAPFDLGALVTATVATFEAEAGARGIRLDLDVHPGDTTVSGAADKIKRVLTNLIRNSLSYTPPGGRVRIGVRSGAGALLVTVEDTGIGIANEAVDRVFEPFWRGDPARTPAEGSGLGLTIARAFIQAHDGSIWVERPPAGGTRLCFVLPHHEPAGHSPAVVSEPGDAPPTGGRTRSGLPTGTSTVPGRPRPSTPAP
jgi:two-component system sensor histidine kinase BaeS